MIIFASFKIFCYFKGNLNWMGAFTECLSLDFFSQYCQYEDPATANVRNDILPHFKLGLCMPKSCSNKDIAELVSFGLSLIPPNVTYHLNVTFPNVTEAFISCHEPAEIDGPAIVAL